MIFCTSEEAKIRNASSKSASRNWQHCACPTSICRPGHKKKLQMHNTGELKPWQGSLNPPSYSLLLTAISSSSSAGDTAAVRLLEHQRKSRRLPKRKCCMMGSLDSTSTWYIFSMPLFTCSPKLCSFTFTPLHQSPSTTLMMQKQTVQCMCAEYNTCNDNACLCNKPVTGQPHRQATD